MQEPAGGEGIQTDGDGGGSSPKAALRILQQLGVKESTAKKQIAGGKLSLSSVSEKVTDASVTALARHSPGLTSINLFYCSKITDASVTVLAQHCPGLTSINLYYCSNITDASITALAPHCPELTNINLYYCSKLTDASVTALARHCHELSNINLVGCRLITDQAKRTLRGSGTKVH